MSSALLVGVPDNEGSMPDLPPGVESLVVESLLSTEEALARCGAGKGDVEAIVIGPQVTNPLALAQRVYQLDRDLGVLILAPRDAVGGLRAKLAFSPYVGRQTRYQPMEDRDDVQRELLRSIEETRARRAHRKTLQGLSARLATAEAPRRQSMAVLDRLLELAPIGVLSLDDRGRIQIANRGALKMFEDVSQLSGATLGDCFEPERREALETLQAEVIRTGAARRALVERLRGGKPQSIEVTLAPLGGPGEPEGFLLIAQDVTDRVRSERERESLLRELENAVRLRDEFLSIASHELRTPLTAMLGWIGILRSGKLAPEKHTRALATIERNARTQAQLIEDLLDVSRIVSGKVRLEVMNVVLADVVRQAVDSVTPAAEAKGLSLGVELPEPSLSVCGDPHRLLQVIWNLLSNAIKFTPQGGRISVALRRARGSVEIVVSDDGVGIRPAFLPYIFERFRQAETGPTRSYGGLGIGLSIVRHFVELHGGEVEVKSEGEGKGATFLVRLPIATPGARP